MASMGSKRGRSSESPPPQRDGEKRSQKQSLAIETGREIEQERNNIVQVEENSGGIMSLGLETKHPAERGSKTLRFGEFLNTCGWCNKKIGNQSVYMFGNFHAYCTHECQEKVVSLLYERHLFESGLAEHIGINAKKRSN